MAESTQHKLSRIRAPRVQITYDVETGGETQKKELPLVVGIMSDLSGKSEKPQPKLKEKKFVEIDRDNFNDIMDSLEPRIEMTVDNKLTAEDDDSKLNVALKFKSMDDFNPINVVDQIPALKKLHDARSHLMDLCGKLDGNDRLEEMLEDIVKNTPELEQLKKEKEGEGEGEGE